MFGSSEWGDRSHQAISTKACNNAMAPETSSHLGRAIYQDQGHEIGEARHHGTPFPLRRHGPSGTTRGQGQGSSCVCIGLEAPAAGGEGLQVLVGRRVPPRARGQGRRMERSQGRQAAGRAQFHAGGRVKTWGNSRQGRSMSGTVNGGRSIREELGVTTPAHAAHPSYSCALPTHDVQGLDGTGQAQDTARPPGVAFGAEPLAVLQVQLGEPGQLAQVRGGRGAQRAPSQGQNLRTGPGRQSDREEGSLQD